MRFTARNYGQDLTHLLTLTYPGVSWAVPLDGLAVKGHLNSFLTWFRRRFNSPRYFWFLEFQERGAPHFHMFFQSASDLSCGREGRLAARVWSRICFKGLEPEADDPAGQGEWESARADHLAAGVKLEPVRKPHAVAAYASKESTKMVQKEVPANYHSVGRFWGVSQNFRQVKPVVMEGEVAYEDRSRLTSVACEVSECRVEAWRARGVPAVLPVLQGPSGGLVVGAAGSGLPPLLRAVCGPVEGAVVDELGGDLI